MPLSSREDLDCAFVPKGTLMFLDLIAALQTDPQLKAERRRDMISGLRRVAKALGRAPQDIPCSSRWLQPRLAKIAPASLGLTAKTWQNAVSDARSAMVHAGIVDRRINRFTDLSPEWQSLWRGVLESGDPTLPAALRRFVHFLNNQDIAPDEVCDNCALAFREAVTKNEISKSPDVSYRAAVNGWNLATRRRPDWPQTRLSLTSRQKIISLPEAAFPETFQGDLEGLMDRLSQPDPFSGHSPTKALRPATLAHYRRLLRRFASELVHSGVASEQITGLHCLLEPTMAERGLRQMLSNSGNKTTKLISEVAALLRNLGRITEQSERTQKQLIKLAGRVAAKPQTGMTRKNRDRLRVLQDEKTMLRLMMLPDRIFTPSAAGKSKNFTIALAREDAVAIAILLVCPIRVKNLAGIHLERHIHRPGDGRAYLVLTEDDLKNERPLEFELPGDVIRMIDRHLANRCPQMCPPGTPWLFPKRDGSGSVKSGQLANRISKRVLKETGLAVNAHLFRHFAVMNWLDANPGGYEVARRLLGHSEVSHTINMYSGLEVKSATRAFADLIASKKGTRP